MEELIKYGEIFQGLFDVVDDDSNVSDDHGDISEADDEFISKAYKDIKEAVDDLDCDRLEMIFSDLKKYHFPPEHRELFERLQALSEKFEYDMINEILTQVTWIF